MAGVYTVLLGRTTGAAGQDLLLFSVGGEQAIIVRDVLIVNEGDAEGEVHLYVSTGLGNLHLQRTHIQPWQTLHQDLRQRLAPGDSVRAYSTCSRWNTSVTGYLLGVEPSWAQQLPA